MDYVKIGNRVWDVLVVELSESYTILYSENTGRTMSTGAKMTLDPLGTFYGHKVTFRCRKGHEDEYDELFDYLAKPRYDGIAVDIVHNQETIKYQAYISNAERSLKRIEKNGKVRWDNFTANIVAMEAQVVPE